MAPPLRAAPTVCNSLRVGVDGEVRPSSHYARRLKSKQMHERGLPGAPSDYREDHIVPLCAGGHPSDPRTLWPQPFKGKWSDNDKNQLEQSVCRMLCRGAITLEAAQAIFLAPDWRTEYERFFTDTRQSKPRLCRGLLPARDESGGSKVAGRPRGFMAGPACSTHRCRGGVQGGS
jgi:hypothetical protein